MRDEQIEYIRRVLQKDWFATGHRLAKQLEQGKITAQKAAIDTKIARNSLLAAADAMGFRLWPKDGGG